MACTFTIGVEGQWIINFNINHKLYDLNDGDLSLEVSDLIELTLIEDTGNLLSTWEMAFISDDKWLKIWDEGLEMDITMAKSRTENVSGVYKLMIVTKHTNTINQRIVYHACGICRYPAFTQVPHVHSWRDVNGTTILEEIAGANKFNVINEDNIKSTEKMSWHQSNVTDKRFLDYVVQHCFIQDSLVGVGISGSDYIIVDIAKQTTKGPKYVVSTKEEDASLADTRFIPINEPKIKSNSAFLNAQGAYGSDTPIINVDIGMQMLYHPSVDLHLTETWAPNNGQINRKVNPPVYVSRNQDPNFIAAKCNYDLGMALLNMQTILTSIIAGYFPLRLYDPIYIFPVEIEGSLNPVDSGKYLVTKVGRTISNGKMQTNIEGSRNDHN